MSTIFELTSTFHIISETFISLVSFDVSDMSDDEIDFAMEQAEAYGKENWMDLNEKAREIFRHCFDGFPIFDEIDYKSLNDAESRIYDIQNIEV